MVNITMQYIGYDFFLIVPNPCYYIKSVRLYIVYILILETVLIVLVGCQIYYVFFKLSGLDWLLGILGIFPVGRCT